MPSAMQVQPYLFFEGRCDEALAFYRGALGAEVTMLMRFKESPDPGMVAPGTGDKVMHASFSIGRRRCWRRTADAKRRRASRASHCRCVPS